MSSGTPEKNSAQEGSNKVAPSGSVSQVVDDFVREVDSLATSLPLIMLLVSAGAEVEREKFEKFLAQRCTPEANKENRYIIPVETYQEFCNARRAMQRSVVAARIIPRSFLTSLVSHYDAFLGNLMRSMFYLRPELLNSSERTLSFKDLVEFTNIDDARNYVTEKEIEALIRNSHCDQFEWMEDKFKLPLRKDLPCWPTFVEVMERRNLFVHWNGIISAQYLKVCRANKVRCDQLRQGEELDVSPDYFRTAYETILEVGVKLASVLWRKLKPEQREQADAHLNEVSLDLIRDEKYTVAQRLLDFATQFKKFGSEPSRRIFILNRAQAYKWAGDEKKTRSIIAGEDWTASSDKFRLGVAVLMDNFEEAARIMKHIGPDDSPKKGDYKEWPIFKQFRQSERFAKAYTEVFSEPWVEVAREADTPDQPNEVEKPEAVQ